LRASMLSLSLFFAPSVIISGNNIRLTQPLRDFAEKKCNSATSHFSSLLRSVELNLKVEHRGGGLHDNTHNGYRVHVAQAVCTLRREKRVLRVCSESDENMYASLDSLSDRLSRQLRKCKERKSPRHAVGASRALLALSEASGAMAEDPTEQVPLKIRSVAAIDEDEVLSEATALSQLRAEYRDELDDEMLSELVDDLDNDVDLLHQSQLVRPMSVEEAVEAIDLENNAHHFHFVNSEVDAGELGGATSLLHP